MMMKSLTSKRGQTEIIRQQKFLRLQKMLMEILLLHIKMVQRIQNLYQEFTV